MRTALLVSLWLLAGCAVEGPKLKSPDEIACGEKASAIVRERFPDAEFDANGIPVLRIGREAPYYAWGIYTDRCLQRRGFYD